MVKFKVTEDSFINKEGKEIHYKRITMCGDTIIGPLEIPIKAAFASDAKLLPLLIADDVEA